jgi:hypothetical protein
MSFLQKDLFLISNWTGSIFIQCSKTLIDYGKVKETYDYPMQGIWKCVDGVPKVKHDSPLTRKATEPVQKP